MEKEEYAAIVSVWADETTLLLKGFRSLFPDTTEGFIKYLFALHYAVLWECTQRGIPEEAFSKVVPTIIASWFAAGKPEGVELTCISGETLADLKKRIQEIREGGGGKPSSDA